MTHIGLFEGIGGFSLAARWIGWETIAWCEWNEFGQKVLKYHFPNAKGYGDITKTDFKKYANKINILTGGFPCQPFSLAGKRKGKEDERYLWHEMLRAIQEIKPEFVIAENVYGIVNIDGGLVFDQVCADLENEGYEVQAFIIPACAKNAPHRRDRVWFVAYSDGIRQSREKYGQKKTKRTSKDGKRETFTNTNDNGFIKCYSQNEKYTNKDRFNALNDINEVTLHPNSTSPEREHLRQKGEGKFNISNSGNEFDNFKNFPTQSPICGGNDGIPDKLDGITIPKWRAESIKAYGNAIVPQVAYEIFKAIDKFIK